jgi:hypothetical protein
MLGVGLTFSEVIKHRYNAARPSWLTMCCHREARAGRRTSPHRRRAVARRNCRGEARRATNISAAPPSIPSHAALWRSALWRAYFYLRQRAIPPHAPQPTSLALSCLHSGLMSRLSAPRPREVYGDGTARSSRSGDRRRSHRG